MNKLLFLISIVISYSATTYGQRITINDLRFGLTHQVGETEDYLLRKGLTFSRSDDLSESKPSPKYHQFDKDNYTLNYLSVSITEYKGSIYRCSATTLKQSDYLFLRNEVKNLGYKLQSSKIDETSSTVDYVKGNFKVSFTTSKTSDGNKMYYVELIDNLKKKNMYTN